MATQKTKNKQKTIQKGNAYKKDRDKRVINELNDILNETQSKNFSRNKELDCALNKLFITTAWGFREIVLVISVAYLLDERFRASTGLYNCNPRAIYEGPIKQFLIDNKIPHRKSGPLNIAKATVGLNSEWAAHRRPNDAAKAVVDIVNYIENEDVYNRAKEVAVKLLSRLLEFSYEMQQLSVTVKPDNNPEFLYYLCDKLIVDAPDFGNTPQKIVALLLQSFHKDSFYNQDITISGGEDRASVASTTSKKPGDINEEVNGKILKVYEVTIKKFDLNRIKDSFDCVSIYNRKNNDNIHEIIVLCRNQDCPDGLTKSNLSGYLGSYTYSGITYRFLNIQEWICLTLQHMTNKARENFFVSLNEYVSELNTAESIKRTWKEICGKIENT